ncbi:TnsA-like heteromeric transposase endonuclease subunit [Gordonia iterans]
MTENSGSTVNWTFRFAGDRTSRVWDWQTDGSPDLGRVVPVRKPRSSERQRHIPVSAYSMTMRDHLELESGLEHDLLRSLDRLRHVVVLVAQPCQIARAGSSNVRNTPDLLSLDDSGSVTLWNARPTRRMDEKFKMQVAMVESACASVGWRHEVFNGLGRTERLNLLWLHGYRRQPSSYERVAGQIVNAATQSGATLGSLFRLDTGDGETIAVVWHMVWSGELAADLSEKLAMETSIRAGAAA